MFNEINDLVCQFASFMILSPPGCVFKAGLVLGVLYAVFSVCWVLGRHLLPRTRRVVRRQSFLVRYIAYMTVVLWALFFMLLAVLVFSGLGAYVLYLLVSAWFPCLVMLGMVLITRSVMRRTS